MKEFDVHMLNEHGISKAKAIAEAFNMLLTILLAINPEASREMSLARTKLEEACFFVKKATASNPENSQ